MEESKLIQRYAYFQRNNNAAAGVYTTTAVISPTAKLNVILNKIMFGPTSKDAVTSQAIRSTYDLIINATEGVDQPALDDSDIYHVNLGGSTGSSINVDLYLFWAAGLTLTFTATYYLETVTANIIGNRVNLMLGYLCPEDYLSVNVIK